MEAPGRTLVARTLAGPDVLDRLGEPLDDLLEATGAPVTARRPWLATWVRSYDDFEPWAVVVEGAAGRLEAAALLARRRVGRRLDVVGLGQGPSDNARLPARDPEAAEALARAVADELRALRGAWRLRVEQLPVDDPVAAAVLRQLQPSELQPGDGSPILRFDQGRDFKSYVGHNSRGVAKTMRNRVKRNGLILAIERFREPHRIAAELPEVERVHRDRDVQLIRRSDLDDPRMERFWRSVIPLLARREEVELVTLRLSGELAGYVVAFLDGGAYRMWDGRFAPKYAWYSPGRLTDQAALAAALEDERFELFDWMRGEEEYKLRNSNAIVPAVHLVAWSSRWTKVRTKAPRVMKERLKRLRDRSSFLKRAWLAVKARTIMREKRP